MKLKRLITYSLIILILSCGSTIEKEKFKYLELERLSFIKRINYSNKIALNSIYIELKNGNGLIVISFVPFTKTEYKENVSIRLKKSMAKSRYENIFVEVDNRKLNGIKELKPDNYCSIFCYDYYMGVAILFEYMGTCNNVKLFEEVLSSIKYRISKEKAEKDRSDFLYVIKTIEKLDIPAYRNSQNLNRKFIFSGLTKRLSYDIEIEANSIKVIDFYKEYFSKIHWKPYRVKFKGTWHNNKLFYSWIDETEEIQAELIILSQDNNSVMDLSTQTVNMFLTPYRGVPRAPADDP